MCQRLLARMPSDDCVHVYVGQTIKHSAVCRCENEFGCVVVFGVVVDVRVRCFELVLSHKIDLHKFIALID